MRLEWWNDGLHLSAESEEEHQALAKCWEALQMFKICIGEKVSSIPVNKVQTDDEQSVV